MPAEEAKPQMKLAKFSSKPDRAFSMKKGARQKPLFSMEQIKDLLRDMGKIGIDLAEHRFGKDKLKVMVCQD